MNFRCATLRFEDSAQRVISTTIAPKPILDSLPTGYLYVSYRNHHCWPSLEKNYFYWTVDEKWALPVVEHWLVDARRAQGDLGHFWGERKPLLLEVGGASTVRLLSGLANKNPGGLTEKIALAGARRLGALIDRLDPWVGFSLQAENLIQLKPLAKATNSRKSKENHQQPLVNMPIRFLPMDWWVDCP